MPVASPQYAAVFGRNPALSAAELTAAQETWSFSLAPLGRAAALLDWPDAPRHAKDLGGTTKLVALRTETFDTAEDAARAITTAVPAEGKIRFGTSSYGKASAMRLTSVADQALQAAGHRTRYLAGHKGRTEGGELSAVQVRHNRLLGKGIDWCVFETTEGFRAGATCWVYDFAGFSTRDYDKPATDTVRGMLPPQLARVMVNLGTRSAEGTGVYDPFCGSGVVPLEALQCSHGVFGSDISQQAIDDTERNIRWLAGNGEIVIPGWQLATADATGPLPFDRVDAIATEGYLGEPVRQSTTETQVRQQADLVSDLLLRFFAQARQALTDEGRIVITLPIWRLSRGQRLRLDIVDRILALGYTKVRPLPDGWLHEGLSDRDSIEVSRPKQRVIHELFIFQKS